MHRTSRSGHIPRLKYHDHALVQHVATYQVDLFVSNFSSWKVTFPQIPSLNRSFCARRINATPVLLEKNVDDYWNVDGERELSDAGTGFTRFIVLSERLPDGFSWSGERLTRNQTTSRPENVWPDMWKHIYDAAKRKAKQMWIIEKPKLDNARQ